MHSVTIEENLSSWREAARPLLAAKVPPHEIIWSDGTTSPSLFEESAPYGTPQTTSPSQAAAPPKIPKAFFQLAKTVACHRDPQRWSLLYTAAFRLSAGGEPRLLSVSSDPLVRRLQHLDKAVRRDRHKMTAFVRFRKVGEHPENEREQFIAWFEPEHHIVELTAPFFVNRFSSFDWSILGPDRCAHWDGAELKFSPGVPQSAAPKDDELEDYWRTYYANIFNPARLKLKAMQSEMPKKYWKNLPEASIIAELTSGASNRAVEMVERGVNSNREHVSAKVPKGAQHPDTATPSLSPIEALERVADLSLYELRDAASRCRSCALCEAATQTVFGHGNPNARIVLVGEQPGDQEDIEGLPFVGPAGKLLRECLVEAGLNQDEIYFTNTVKHFKWKPGSGQKQRLHDTANPSEVQTCKPWVIAEILKIRPEFVVTLGATAAKALVDPKMKLLKERGRQPGPKHLAENIISTVHPSYLLRIPDPERQQTEIAQFIADLKLVTESLSAQSK